MAKVKDDIDITNENARDVFVGVNSVSLKVMIRSKEIKKITLEEAEYIVNSVIDRVKNKAKTQRDAFIVIDVIQFILLIIVLFTVCK